MKTIISHCTKLCNREFAYSVKKSFLFLIWFEIFFKFFYGRDERGYFLVAQSLYHLLLDIVDILRYHVVQPQSLVGQRDFFQSGVLLDRGTDNQPVLFQKLEQTGDRRTAYAKCFLNIALKNIFVSVII